MLLPLKYGNFNSIKVRLERRKEEGREEGENHFNSIKVRLERERNSLSRREPRISIP